MILRELLQDLEDYRLIGQDDMEITDICIDSRTCSQGCLFACVPGTRMDRHAFAPQAVKDGAVALLVERELEDTQATQVIVSDSRQAMAMLAAAFYGHPAQQMDIIGVTGTNGKTTTTYMIREILNYAGFRSGLIGTVANYVNDKKVEQHLTTPDPMELHGLLRQMLDAGCDKVVMEVSAHALELRKLAGIRFRVGVFTNLTQDHLDDFKTMEHYQEAKAKLFSDDVILSAVVNCDDLACGQITAGFSGKKLTYGLDSEAMYRGKDVRLSDTGTDYTLSAGPLAVPIHLNMPGRFNVYNSLAAIAVCMELGVSIQIAKSGIERLQNVAGRIQRIPIDKAYSVIVDYAHSPDSLENIIKAVRLFTKGRVITVFGCGGDRDNSKRPIMGRISGRLSDFSIVTSDNPRTEVPAKIIDMIEQGIREVTDQYTVEEDRKEAIRKAMDMAQPGDVIIIAGKGHENYQDIMGVKHHFDDSEVVIELADPME